MLKPWPRSRWVTAGLALLLAAVAVLGGYLIATLRTHQQMANDLAENNNVKYGLLNAEVWMLQVTEIIEKKIVEFEMTPDNRAAMKASLERMLETLITEADKYLRKQNQQIWWKRAKQGVQDAFIDMSEVKAAVPEYADKILDEMNKPEARQELNRFLGNLLADLTRTTFAAVDRSRIQALQARHQCWERYRCNQVIGERLAANNLRALQLTLALLALTVLLFSLAWLTRRTTGRAALAILSLCCFVLMLCGVLTPMIEVEARISELRFVLLEEPVVFTDQVLYFQSKSVLDVVQVLAATGQPDMVLVALLVMTFSVLFPLAKLAASFVLLYTSKPLAITRFFALKSGKWSMADVFVVAIFMAYIGFNGLISSQLTEFRQAGGGEVDVLTTNGTSLQIGFFMFLAFCMASLVTSTMIEGAKSPRPSADPLSQRG